MEDQQKNLKSKEEILDELGDLKKSGNSDYLPSSLNTYNIQHDTYKYCNILETCNKLYDTLKDDAATRIKVNSLISKTLDKLLQE